MPFPPPRPHLRNCFLASLAYLAVTWICVWLLKNTLTDAATWVRALVSVLPVIPIAVAIRSVVRLILAGDELQQRIDLEALAVASVAVGLGSLTLSLLMTAQVISLSGKTAMLWIFPAMWLSYGLAKVWATRRYQ